MNLNNLCPKYLCDWIYSLELRLKNIWSMSHILTFKQILSDLAYVFDSSLIYHYNQFLMGGLSDHVMHFIADKAQFSPFNLQNGLLNVSTNLSACSFEIG